MSIPRGRPMGRTFAMLVLCALLNGCSWIVVQTAPPEAEWATRRHAPCEDSRIAPGLDVTATVLGLALVGAGIWAASQAPSRSEPMPLYDQRPLATAIYGMYIASGAAVAGVYGSSAIYGIRETARCDRYNAFASEEPPLPAGVHLPSGE